MTHLTDLTTYDLAIGEQDIVNVRDAKKATKVMGYMYPLPLSYTSETFPTRYAPGVQEAMPTSYTGFD